MGSCNCVWHRLVPLLIRGRTTVVGLRLYIRVLAEAQRHDFASDRLHLLRWFGHQVAGCFCSEVGLQRRSPCIWGMSVAEKPTRTTLVALVRNVLLPRHCGHACWYLHRSIEEMFLSELEARTLHEEGRGQRGRHHSMDTFVPLLLCCHFTRCLDFSCVAGRQPSSLWGLLGLLDGDTSCFVIPAACERTSGGAKSDQSNRKCQMPGC